MDVWIKEFNVDMQVRNKGIEFEVRDPNGGHRGDLILTKAKLEWCEGRKRSGVSKTWEEFINWMNS
jgi:hypothetical protein